MSRSPSRSTSPKVAEASVLGGIAGYGIAYWIWEHGLREFAFEYVLGCTPERFTDISTWRRSRAFMVCNRWIRTC